MCSMRAESWWTMPSAGGCEATWRASSASSGTPEPFRDDRLVARFHRRAVVHGVEVRRAVGAQVVPQHRGAGLRRDRAADADARPLAARLDVVQVNHEGPGALAERGRGVALELVGLEIVGMRLELLRHLVILALARLGHPRIDAHPAADALVQRAHPRLAADDIAGAA